MDVYQGGTNGQPGSNGTSAGVSGGNATAGTDAAPATAQSATDTEDTATAVGGYGGSGGAGDGNASGGAGAGGGNAQAQATTTTSSTNSTSATATATGGGGGAGGYPGQSGGGGNVGGTAGGASATSATDSNAQGEAIANATETGGNGGPATDDYISSTATTYGGTVRTGDAGGTVSGTSASAVGTTDATATVQQTGGDGGAGGIGGAAASSTLTNAVSGETTQSGFLGLTQTAKGGNGGVGRYGKGGTGGAASSSLTFDDTQNVANSATLGVDIQATGGGAGAGITGAAATGTASATGTITGAHDLNVEVVALGGGGGYAGIATTEQQYTGGQAGSGSSATATGSATSKSATGNVTLTAAATGGNGGTYDGNGTVNNGGNGGVASGVTATAIGGASASVYADEVGGAGGDSYGGRGGNGASVVLNNAVSGVTQAGTLYLSQYAVGGVGGDGFTTPSYVQDPSLQGTSGNGGSASTSLTLDDRNSATQSRSITVSITAFGGGGGEQVDANNVQTLTGQGASASGSGNVQTGTTLASGAATTVTETVSTSSGAGTTAGNATTSAIAAAGTTNVTASADARVATQQAGVATATAQGTGGAGQVQANAETTMTTTGGGHGAIKDLFTSAESPVAGKTIAYTSAMIGGTASFSTSDQALSTAVGMPTGTSNGTDLSAELTDLFDWNAGGVESPTASGTDNQEATITVALDLTQLSLTHDLMLDLHQAMAVGSGVTNIFFGLNAGSAHINQSFTSVTQADQYFTDNVIDLGPIDQLTSSTTDLSVSLSLEVIEDPPGAGFFNEIQIGATAACYAEGTRILTPQGERMIETLRPGDRVVTAAGRIRPVVWTGRRHVDLARQSRPWDVMPVRIRADAFAPGQPLRDLIVSPDHAVFAHGALVPIRYLLNGASIVQEPAARITWWHVELDTHDVVLADGLPAESYLDTGNRCAFEGGDALDLHPDFARRAGAPHACAPLVLGGDPVRRIKADLLDRLPALGFQTTNDPDLEILAGTLSLPPQYFGDWLSVVAPDHATKLRLVSRHVPPAELDPASTDWRRLGVAVSALRLDGHPVALRSELFATGWHPAADGLRWSDGDGVLMVPPGSVVELRLARFQRYHAAA